MKNKDITYKILISTVFGLTGFILNFFPVHFWFPPHKASFMIGLVFPMIITLAWGWKYGLLSALAGGCQTLWFLWLPTGGYGAFVSVPMYTFWIVWHGYWQKLYKRANWKASPYVMEIGFRIFNTIVLYTVWRWVFTLNPPPWSPELPTRMAPLDFTNFCVIKEAVNGYIVLLISDVLLNIGVVRRILRLWERSAQIRTTYIISASILFGCLIWIIDGIINYLVFIPGAESLLDSIILDVPNHTLFMKTLFIIACLTGGLLVSRFFRRQLESEEALRDSEEKLSQIVDGSSTATFVINKKHTITHWNKACENLTGVTASKMIGTQKQWLPFYSVERPVLADVVVDEMADEDITGYYGDKYKKSALIEDAYEVEDFFPAFGDKWLFFNAATLKDHRGRIIGAIETFQDITERKRAEEELKKHREHLEELVKERTAELEAFSYSVSHDLRAPLRHIDGFTKLLNKKIKNKIDKQAQNYFDNIISSSKQMNQLIDDLLIFSRMSRKDVEKTNINMKTIVDEAMQTFDFDVKENNISITVDDMPDVNLDASLIRQAWANLISNAIKFTGNKENPEIHIGTDKDIHGNTIFFIKDNGVGFDQKYADKIFGVFQRLHNINEFPGTGIGLANVKRIIIKHGGDIRAEGKINKGASFLFTLPDA